MRTLLSFLLSFLLLACDAPEGNKPPRTDNRPTSLEPFADSLVRLPQTEPASLDKAAGYFQRLVPTDSTLADSAAVLFLRTATRVLDSVNQALLTDTTDYATLVYGMEGPLPPRAIAVRDSLARHHVVLQGDGEGSVYALLDYRWALGALQPKTSAATDRYLQLLADHETRPALLDASVAIELTEVADRLGTAEALPAQRLPKTFAEEAQEMATFYTAVLLFGSDNSPALMDKKLELTPEFLEAQRYFLRRYPGTAAAKEIQAFHAVVAAKDEKAYSEWRQRYLGGD